jgi:hypothetical protein
LPETAIPGHRTAPSQGVRLFFFARSSGTKVPLLAEDRNRFYAQASRATYAFTRTDKETSTALDFEVDGIPIMQLQKETH